MFDQILLIEDNVLDQRMIAEALKDLNTNLKISTSLSEAMKILEGKDIDLIISDIMLNDGLGLSLLNGNEIPKIFITASTNIDLVLEAMNKGASDYLIKDIENTYLKVLRNRIEKLFNEIRAEREFQFLETTYKDIVDNSSDFIFIIDKECESFIFMNQSMYFELTGTNEIDPLELKVADLFPEHHDYLKGLFGRHALNELISEVKLTTQNFKSENTLLEGNILLTLDFNKQKVLRGIFKNMTQRRKLEEEITRLLRGTTDI
ncbi:MAG: response regulator [Bacteroidota bacterium]